MGLIRRGLDSAEDDFYGEEDWQHKKANKTDDEIDREIAEYKEGIGYWEKGKRNLTKMHKAGKPLEEIYDWEENWQGLYEDVCHLLPDDGHEQFLRAKGLREFLNTSEGWSDDSIWKRLIELCDDNAKFHNGEIARLEKEKQKNRLRLQVIKKLGSMASTAGFTMPRSLMN